MMDGPADWTRFYPSATAASTVVSTGAGPAQTVHTIEGRVGKSGRRRTRASRRTPTTLLNTDPANFRAMVQQFTGAPVGPYASPAGPVISFGYTDRILHHQQRQPPVNDMSSLGQFGQHQFDGAVTVPGGDSNSFTGEGFVEGFDSTTAASGFFLEGMLGGGNRGGGYLL